MLKRYPAIGAYVFADMVYRKETSRPSELYFVVELLTCGSGRATREVSRVMHRIIRSPVELMYVVNVVTECRGWGRSFRKAVAQPLQRMPMASLREHLDDTICGPVTIQEMVYRSTPRSRDTTRDRWFRAVQADTRDRLRYTGYVRGES